MDVETDLKFLNLENLLHNVITLIEADFQIFVGKPDYGNHYTVRVTLNFEINIQFVISTVENLYNSLSSSFLFEFEILVLQIMQPNSVVFSSEFENHQSDPAGQSLLRSKHGGEGEETNGTKQAFF